MNCTYVDTNHVNQTYTKVTLYRPHFVLGTVILESCGIHTLLGSIE
jgi:hypothetical protein